MNANELRNKYLRFFEQHGHKIIPSASLIPENDPTTLFTGSGMQPMLPYLLGEAHPEGKRLTDSQKCFRSQDIEEIGDNRHTTFFEMLGNWSLGDYFKKEQILWMFSFLTKEIGLDPHRLYITVFRGKEDINIPCDEESVRVWKEAFISVDIDAKAINFSDRDGMQDGRIFYYDEKKNWWSRFGVSSNMPLGEPGGPDSEMFWDFGENLCLHEKSIWKDQPCHVNCDCGRFLEIGNNVFMEYHRTENGFDLLPNKNVDFGGGFERILAAKQNNPDIFQTDLFAQMQQTIEQMSGKTYQEAVVPFRVIMDHLRAAVFLIYDGAIPSNKDQGYFTRRLIRRAIRFADELGIKGAFCEQFASSVIQTYKGPYPNLFEQQDRIFSEFIKEEAKFQKTIESGLKKLRELVLEKKATGQDFVRLVSNVKESEIGLNIISGKEAFDIYQTYGFPPELIEEELHNLGNEIVGYGYGYSHSEFEEEFKKHQNLSRAGAEQKFSGGLADHSDQSVRYHTATHLLHQALRTVLGEHVFQRGSNITSERLRFDFSHSEKLTEEQKKRVEDLVNEQIQKNLPVHCEILSQQEAKNRGAIGIFEDKYAQLGGNVKVYFIGKTPAELFSKEVCGGPHVEYTGELGTFKIQKEESVSSGIRRIKAVLS